MHSTNSSLTLYLTKPTPQTGKYSRPHPTHIHITTDQVQAAINNSKNNNSTEPNNINIKHLKHIGKLGQKYLTNIYNATLNDNKIPQVWKLAKIIPVPKPNKDINIGTSYRPISILSVIAKTLEKLILPDKTQNIPNITTQHGFKTKHSTNTALHTINNTVATGFNQPISHTRTIAVALDMSKAFDTVNIHTLIDKLAHSNIPYSDTSQTTSKDAWHTQHSGTIHLQNANLNLEFHKATSFHPYSSTSTLQTFHWAQIQYNLPHMRTTQLSQHHTLT